MAAVVELARKLEVRVAVAQHGLLRAGPKAGGKVDRRRLQEGRCHLFRARLRENEPGLGALNHPPHRAPGKAP